VLLGTPPNFAWLTGGRSNRIDITREPGAGALFVDADGRCTAFANVVEMPRLIDEALVGLPVTPVESGWTAERAQPGWAVETARRMTGRAIGADWPAPGALLVDTSVDAARVPLLPEETGRLGRLGAEVGVAVGDLCRSLVPGQTEEEIAAQTIGAVARLGARSVVTLVGADERLKKYRHPLPTPTPWRDIVMVATCVERHGLTVAISRIVASTRPTADWLVRLGNTASVFGALLDSTRDGATGAELFTRAVEAYFLAGVPGEELRHHQGGAIGYRARDWVAHPESRDRVTLPQAFAWNPSITGTKVEDTALVTPDGVDLLTSTPDWPTIPITVQGRTLAAAGVLVL
jgi:Xaa-Pro aminopeptidase